MDDRQDRRRQNRRKDRVALVFHYAQEKCEVNTMDVSRSGALIRTPVSFPSGTLLILECPALCAEGASVRLLARVVRASQNRGDPGSVYSGLGLLWIRAYSSTGEAKLREFLTDILGFAESEIGELKQSPTGDAVFDFPSPAAVARDTDQRAPRSQELAEYQENRERFMGFQRGRFRMEVPVVYSVHNMHYRGNLVSLGPDGIAVSSRGALPFLFSKVTVRYPLESSPTSPRVVLFAETEMVLEPFGREPGFFTARIIGIDELNNRGIFRMHLKSLTTRNFNRWE
jgi:hypothetical protein